MRTVYLKFLSCFSVSIILLVFSSRNFSGRRVSSSLNLKCSIEKYIFQFCLHFIWLIWIHLSSVKDWDLSNSGPEQTAELLVLIDRSLAVRESPRYWARHQLLELVAPAGHLPLSPGLSPPLLPPPFSLHLEEVERPPPPDHLDDPAVPPLIGSAEKDSQQAPVQIKWFRLIETLLSDLKQTTSVWRESNSPSTDNFCLNARIPFNRLVIFSFSFSGRGLMALSTL